MVPTTSKLSGKKSNHKLISIEILRVQIHANCRIRRIYFTDQLLSNKKIPNEYKAFSAVDDEGAMEKNLGGDMGEEH
jgi:hypothetical protein